MAGRVCTLVIGTRPRSRPQIVSVTHVFIFPAHVFSPKNLKSRILQIMEGIIFNERLLHVTSR